MNDRARDRPFRRLPDPGAIHDEREIDAVVERLRTSNRSLGPRVAEFEAAIAVRSRIVTGWW